MNIGVVVARFQVDTLHDGHQLLLKAVEADNDQVVVVLGICQPKNTMENPLDFRSRRLMVLEVLPYATVLPLADHVNDAAWSNQLDELLSTYAEVANVRLYGGRDSFREYYTGKHETVPFGHVHHRSGTDVRSEIGTFPRSSADFRAGVIYASQNRYPTSFATVDAVVWDGDSIVLGRKPGMDQWCIIGGFADPESDSYEDDARREVLEETGLFVKDLDYVCSMKVDDWRYRRGPDKIKTVLFNADVVFKGASLFAAAADDIAEVGLFNFGEAAKLVQPCHTELVLRAIEKRAS